MSIVDKISKIFEQQMMKQLNKEKYSILQVLLESENFFLPFSFDLDKKHVYGINKTSLVKILAGTDWRVDYGVTFISEKEVYTIQIIFKEKMNKKTFIEHYQLSPTDEESNRCRKLEFYILYADFLRIYKEVPNTKGDYWKYALKPGDYKGLLLQKNNEIGGAVDEKA